MSVSFRLCMVGGCSGGGGKQHRSNGNFLPVVVADVAAEQVGKQASKPAWASAGAPRPSSSGADVSPTATPASKSRT